MEGSKRDLSGQTAGSSPAQIVESWFAALYRWSNKSGWPGSGFTRVAMELTDLPGHPARALARRHKSIMISELAKKLANAGVKSSLERAREIWMLTEGAMVMILIQGDASYAITAAEAAKRLVLSRPSSSVGSLDLAQDKWTSTPGQTQKRSE
jgi:hypothetical protein